MKKNLTLEELEETIERVNQEEIKKYTQIEKEKLQDFAENLKELLIKELNTIETGIEHYQEKTIKRTEAINNKLKIAQTRADNLNKQITYNKVKHLLVPTLVGMFLIIGALFGTILTGKVVSYYFSKITEAKEELAKIQEQVEAQKQLKNTYIKRYWADGIGVEKEPIKRWSMKHQLWIVKFR